MKLLEGKTALITGAARGIGRAIAIRLANEGADIAFSDIKLDDNTESLETELADIGVNASAYASDSGSFIDSEKLMAGVVNDFGKIDVLIINAGITRIFYQHDYPDKLARDLLKEAGIEEIHYE